MSFQELVIQIFEAMKAAITPPSSPSQSQPQPQPPQSPPSPLDSPTAKAIRLPYGYFPYDAEKAITSQNPAIWIPSK